MAESPHAHDVWAQARAATLPLVALADPDQTRDGWVHVRPNEVVRPESLSTERPIGLGWGPCGWRAHAVLAPDGTRRARAPEPARAATEPPTSRWRSEAWRAMAELLPNAVDAATRVTLSERMLRAPQTDLLEAERATRGLLATHRALLSAARRVVLHTVATHRAGTIVAPGTHPLWQVLGRQVRLPAARLAAHAPPAVLAADLRPGCPTARQLRAASVRYPGDDRPPGDPGGSP